jgi:hypothetical protein
MSKVRDTVVGFRLAAETPRPARNAPKLGRSCHAKQLLGTERARADKGNRIWGLLGLFGHPWQAW